MPAVQFLRQGERALPHTGEITALLEAVKNGDAHAESRLMALMYKDLHSCARHRMQRERRDHTLQPTALVHETFLRMMRDYTIDLRSRVHFLATASIVMRRVLVDHCAPAGRRQTARRQGQGGIERVAGRRTATRGYAGPR